MEDGPRYLIVHIGDPSPDHVKQQLRRYLQPGDRVVSVYPSVAEPKVYHEFSNHPSGGVELSALLELRHPSWKEKGVGWVAYGEDPAL